MNSSSVSTLHSATVIKRLRSAVSASTFPAIIPGYCFILVLFHFQAYRAAMQTQWSWILQLCSCVEQHLKENAVYFEVNFYVFLNHHSKVCWSLLTSHSFPLCSFSVMPKSPWTSLRACKMPFKGSTVVIEQAACTDWRISSRSPW